MGRLQEFVVSTVCILLILLGVITILFSLGPSSRVEVSVTEAPFVSPYVAWERSCHLDGNVTVCVYVPATYYTTLTVQKIVTRTVAGPGPNVANIAIGAVILALGAIALYLAALAHLRREDQATRQ